MSEKRNFGWIRFCFRCAVFSLTLCAIWYYGQNRFFRDSGTSESDSSREYRVLDPLTSIRIGTWDLSPLNFEKLSDSRRSEIIVEVLNRFDLVAIQGITARNNAVLLELVKGLREKGRNASYAASQGIGTVPQYLAFLYDEDRIVIDRSTLADVIDPQGRLASNPLAALFRAKEPEPEKAFTFFLINIKIDASDFERERDVLSEIYLKFREEFSSEDDLILLGNFERPVHELGSLTLIPELVAVQRDIATTIERRWAVDNILFHHRATTEYVERRGVIDFPREFELDQSEAASISSHLPLWAEFSVFEGGQP